MLKNVFIHILCASVLMSCGSDEVEFSGNSKNAPQKSPVVPDDPPKAAEATPEPAPVAPAQPPKADAPPVVKDTIGQVDWYFTCDGSAPPTTKNQMIGSGTFHAEGKVANSIKLQISGNFCLPQNQKRHAVFIVDNSGSMNDNDPVINGSCGRLEVLEAMLASATKETQFSVVAFSDVIVYASPRFAKTKQELFAMFPDPAHPEDVLCSALSSTFYDAGLNGAAALFAARKEDGVKEVFFVSDGAPTFGHEGFDTATKLKKEGATIAAIMLKGEEAILKDRIASTDAAGKPLFAKAEEASSLKDIFNTLRVRSQIDVVSAEIGYRARGTQDTYTRLNPFDSSKENKFSLSPLQIETDKFPTGVEFYYRYKLRTGQTTDAQASLVY